MYWREYYSIGKHIFGIFVMAHVRSQQTDSVTSLEGGGDGAARACGGRRTRHGAHASRALDQARPFFVIGLTCYLLRFD